ncbi:MAG TPA: radical SAM protein [Chitinophagaceae bacterium]|nr:radical SAM protein [Chitinophagaceae bacterium]
MLKEKRVKSVLNKHKKRDSWFLDDYSVNPYEGCSCNCMYCYIRGSKYGENMEQGLAVKINLPEILDKQLAGRAKKNQYGFVAVGSGTDAYIHQEEKHRMTRQILELLRKHRFPVFISTKRALITRDIDLLKEIDANAILPDDLASRLHRGLILSVSISSMDEKISNRLEPGAIPPLERLELVRQLKKEGFLTGVNAIPVLPYISDKEEELEKIIAAARAHDADYILVGGLTLFGNGIADSKTLYYRFLESYDPSLLPKYQALYKNNFYVPFSYQDELKSKAMKINRKYGIRNTILSNHK